MVLRLYLYQSWGQLLGANPVTYEPRVTHPILEVYSSHCSIKAPIQEWLVENYGTRVQPGFDGEAGEYYIDFPTEADITWFRLMWLS